MNPNSDNICYTESIHSLRIPIIAESDEPKQCFYLSHNKENVIFIIPASDGENVGFSFPKIARGQDIEEMMVNELLRKTKAGRRLHQERIDALLEQLSDARYQAGTAFSEGHTQGYVEAHRDCAMKHISNLTITLLVAFAAGLAVGCFS